MSIAPIWKQFDPLPILATDNHGKKDSVYDDEVDDIFDRTQSRR